MHPCKIKILWPMGDQIIHCVMSVLYIHTQVLPVLVTHLPVKQDEAEIPTIYDCLLQLLQAGEPNVWYFHVFHVCNVI